MANQIPENPDDRRDVVHEGSSLSGSTKRNNDATEKAIHPQAKQAETGRSDSEVNPHSPERDRVDQDPGQRQKQNQGGEKDDPLAA